MLPIVWAGCAGSVDGPDGTISFAILDVGQGLAQLGVSDGRAIAWDMGPRGSCAQWAHGYEAMGSPFVEQLVLSHTDEDHRGGLTALAPSVAFSGAVVTSVYEDTALIRRCGGAWASRLRFRTIAAGDTLGGLEGVLVQCVWPPPGRSGTVPVAPDVRNELSLVFRITTGAASVLITSDIDSAVARELVWRYGTGLISDIVIVPHHGSSGSVHRSFYGHVMPSWAVVSCGEHNDYGHPSDELVDVLFDLGVPLLSTSVEGHVRFHTNGVYWTRGDVVSGISCLRGHASSDW